MCDIQLQIERLANHILEGQAPRWAPTRWWAELLHYTNLVLATNTELERAQTYLRDTGSPKAAEGRLLLRAAERSLRQTGDTPDGDKQEGDENQ